MKPSIVLPWTLVTIWAAVSIWVIASHRNPNRTEVASLVINLDQPGISDASAQHLWRTIYEAHKHGTVVVHFQEGDSFFQARFGSPPGAAILIDQVTVKIRANGVDVNEKLLDLAQLRDRLTHYKSAADLTESEPVLLLDRPENAVTIRRWADVLRIFGEVGIWRLEMMGT